MVEFDGAWLHDVYNPSNYAELRVTGVSRTIQQDITLVETWGRQEPVGYVGSQEHERVRVLFANTDLEAQWVGIRFLVRRQRTRGSVLCFRSREGDRIFSLIMSSGREATKFYYRPSLDLQEVYFEEAV